MVGTEEVANGTVFEYRAAFLGHDMVVGQAADSLVVSVIAENCHGSFMGDTWPRGRHGWVYSSRQSARAFGRALEPWFA